MIENNVTPNVLEMVPALHCFVNSHVNGKWLSTSILYFFLWKIEYLHSIFADFLCHVCFY